MIGIRFYGKKSSFKCPGGAPHGHSKNWMIDRPHLWRRNGGVEAMAMPQRDDTIEAIKRLDALLEYAASPCRRRQSTVGFISETIDNEVLE